MSMAAPAVFLINVTAASVGPTRTRPPGALSERLNQGAAVTCIQSAVMPLFKILITLLLARAELSFNLRLDHRPYALLRSHCAIQITSEGGGNTDTCTLEIGPQLEAVKVIEPHRLFQVIS